MANTVGARIEQMEADICWQEKNLIWIFLEKLEFSKHIFHQSNFHLQSNNFYCYI